jgi:NAD(P)-dependent dehydrogenase (short-subunit alcohol dehydrogenase family)
MKAQSLVDGRRGTIVNTSSGAGLRAAPNISPYIAAKHGVLGLTKSAALENAEHGMRVNAVLPGLIDTPLARSSLPDGGFEGYAQRLPSGRAGTASEVAEAVVWLCSDQASYISGEALQVDMAALAR